MATAETRLHNGHRFGVRRERTTNQSLGIRIFALLSRRYFFDSMRLPDGNSVINSARQRWCRGAFFSWRSRSMAGALRDLEFDLAGHQDRACGSAANLI